MQLYFVSPTQKVRQKFKFNLTKSFYKFTIDNTSYNLGHLWKIFIEYMLVLTEQLGSTDERHLEPKRLFFAVDRWSTQCKRSLSFCLVFLSSVNSFRIDSTGLVVTSCCVGAPSKHPSCEAMFALFTNGLDKDHWTQTSDRGTKIIQMTRKYKWRPFQNEALMRSKDGSAGTKGYLKKSGYNRGNIHSLHIWGYFSL